tara:strand:+ start:157 stop:486 length:330 start_codon:yes stop_codon:yes gene_type:complete
MKNTNKLLITMALIGAQEMVSQQPEWWFEMPEDQQVCFRQCEIKDQWGVIHHDYVRKYDNLSQFLATNPPKDTYVCVDENNYGTKIFTKIKRLLKDEKRLIQIRKSEKR